MCEEKLVIKAQLDNDILNSILDIEKNKYALNIASL